MQFVKESDVFRVFAETPGSGPQLSTFMLLLLNCVHPSRHQQHHYQRKPRATQKMKKLIFVKRKVRARQAKKKEVKKIKENVNKCCDNRVTIKTVLEMDDVIASHRVHTHLLTYIFLYWIHTAGHTYTYTHKARGL